MWVAAALYFLTVFAVGFVFGTLRVLVVAPYVGAVTAVLLELPFMLAVSWFAGRSIVRCLFVPPVFGPRLAMGGGAFILLMAIEVGLSMVGFGQTDGLATLPSLIGLGGQIAFAVIPVVQMVEFRGATRRIRGPEGCLDNRPNL